LSNKKHKQKHYHPHGSGQDHSNPTTGPTDHCNFNPGSVYTVRIEPSAEDQKNQADQTAFWIRQLRLALILNVITALAALAAIVYGFVAYKQWQDAGKNFRIDQRPWVVVNPATKPEEVKETENGEMRGNLLISNIGKTVARNVRGVFRLELISKQLGGDPDVSQESSDLYHPPVHYEFGTLWPNSAPLPLHVPMLKKLPGQEKPITDHDTMAVRLDADMYMRVHGTITYVDAFGHDHWTKFCGTIKGGPYPTGHDASTPSKKCIEYNDSDNND
jgi:hypothetical protein